MRKLFAMAVSALGLIAAGAASTACMILFFDEPEMPKNMIEK